jgi:hypothetical protein
VTINFTNHNFLCAEPLNPNFSQKLTIDANGNRKFQDLSFYESILQQLVSISEEFLESHPEHQRAITGIRHLKKVLDDSNIEMAIFNTSKPQTQDPNQHLALDLKISSSLQNSLPAANFTLIFSQLTNFWVKKKNSSLKKIFSDFFPKSAPKDQETLFGSNLDKNGKKNFFTPKIRFYRETLVGM